MPSGTETIEGSGSLTKLASRLVKLTNPECQQCPLHQETDRVCIPVNPATKRPSNGRMVIVGEAPGGHEEQTGRLFSGPAGTRLWDELSPLGFQRSQFFITNGVKCRPTDNRTPTPREIRICTSEYLVPELGLISPEYGLALGNGGLQATMGRKGITKHNGESFKAHGIQWVAAFHPAAVLRNPRYLAPFREALLVFKRLVRDEYGAVKTISVPVNDKESLKKLVSALKKAKRGAIDIETWSNHPVVGRFPGGGLAWWDPSFRLSHLNITLRTGKSYVVLLWNKDARWKDPAAVLRILKPYIEDIPHWIMHNGMFDQKGLEVSGISIRQAFDTMGAMYALDENNIKDLGYMSRVLVGAEPYKDTVDKSDMYNADLEAAVEYGGKDSDYTFRLESIMRRKMRTEEPLGYHLYKKLLLPAANVLSEVELVGLPIHRGKFKKHRKENGQKIEEAVEQLQEFVPDHMKPYNPNSVPQTADLLYNYHDFPIIQATRTGKGSTAEEVLLRLRDLDEEGVIDAILNYRHRFLYESRYFNPWSQLMDSRGRLHCHFKPFHTVTGRLSSENPNLQQIPRDIFIRGLVGGRRGWTVVECDYSQAELRIAAHLSQDPVMMRAFLTGKDIHTEMAMAITGLTRKSIEPEQRKMAKSVNFGYLYAMGWARFRSYCFDNYGIEVSEAEARNSRDTYFHRYKKLQGWHARQRRAAHRRKWVVSPIGRKRHLWDIDSNNKEIRAEAERQAINSPVQSLASDMNLMTMILIHPQLDPKIARMISTVHDSILFEIRDEAVDDVLPLILDTMENLPLEEDFGCQLTVPIVADAKGGRFWSEGAKAIGR